MNTKNKNRVLLLGGLLLIAATALGYYFYNKGPFDVKNASGKKIDAGQLYNAYSTDSLSAQKMYSGKVVEVSGEVYEISHNQKNEPYLLLKTSSEGSFINCTLEDAEMISLKVGDMAAIKGICSGLGQAEPDLGIKADVYVTRGYLKQ